MPGRLAARLLAMFRICGFRCRFRADRPPRLGNLGSRAITEHVMSTFSGICLVLYNEDCENCSPTTAKSSSVSGKSCERDSHAASQEEERAVLVISYRRGLRRGPLLVSDAPDLARSSWDLC